MRSHRAGVTLRGHIYIVTARVRAGASVFDGLRVLDVSTGIAGAMTAMLLIDNGADVTRVEPPAAPRHAHPRDSGIRVWTRGTRNARLDLTHPDDLDTVRTLARRADVLLESFAPG